MRVGEVPDLVVAALGEERHPGMLRRLCWLAAMLLDAPRPATALVAALVRLAAARAFAKFPRLGTMSKMLLMFSKCWTARRWQM